MKVYCDGKWNTVCDDFWDSEGAGVVCRQLGFVEAPKSLTEAYFGAGDGDIFIDDTECFGWEPTLLQIKINDVFYVVTFLQGI